MARRAAGEGSVFLNGSSRGPGTKWVAEHKGLGIRVYGPSKVEAVTKLKKRIDEAGLTEDVDAPVTIGELLDRFAEAGFPSVKRRSRNRGTSTMERYSWACTHLRAAYVGSRRFSSMRLSEVKVTHVERALRFVYEGKSGTSGKPLADDSVKKVLDTLRMAYSFALNREWVLRNVAEVAILPSDPKGPRRTDKGALSVEDARRLASILKLGQDPYEAFFYVILRTGLRFSEAAGLSVDDFDPSSSGAPVLRIHQALRRERVDGKLKAVVTEGLKNGSGGRPISVPLDVAEVISEHLARNRDRIAEARKRGEVPRLFTNKVGGLLDPAKSRRRLASICRKHEVFVKLDGKVLLDEAGSPRPPGIHELRHTVTNRVMDRGAPSEELRSSLGWKDTRVLYSTYRHPDQSRVSTTLVDYDWLS